MTNLCSGTHRGEFQCLLNLDLWSISFHAVVVFGLGKNLFFKSVVGHCAQLFHFQESFLCDEDFCGGPCAPKCLPPDGEECNGILVQLYDDPEVTGNIHSILT